MKDTGCTECQFAYFAQDEDLLSHVMYTLETRDSRSHTHL